LHHYQIVLALVFTVNDQIVTTFAFGFAHGSIIRQSTPRIVDAGDIIIIVYIHIATIDRKPHHCVFFCICRYG